MRRRIKFKKIITTVLVIALSVTIIGALVSWIGDDEKSISPTIFSRGAIDEFGIYVDSDQSLVNKEYIPANGLTVKPSFEFGGTYDIYFYDKDEVLLDKELGLNKSYKNTFALAQYARIVIHPAIPSDVKAKDFKIKFWEVYGYANDLDITVSKTESIYEDYDNLFNPYDCEVGKKFAGEVTTINSNVTEADESTVTPKLMMTNKVEVSRDYDYYDIYVHLPEAARWPTFGLFDANGNLITDSDNNPIVELVDADSLTRPTWVKLTINVSELTEFTGVHIRGNIGANSICYIYGYND